MRVSEMKMFVVGPRNQAGDLQGQHRHYEADAREHAVQQDRLRTGEPGEPEADDGHQQGSVGGGPQRLPFHALAL